MTAPAASNAEAPAALPPVVRAVTVTVPPEAAFRRFTAEISSWWPLRTHSVGGPKAERVEIEPGIGGRIVEHIAGGETSVWGRITAWEPPGRLAFTWHPGDAPVAAQDIEILFESAPGGTRVTLTHKGFERMGPNAAMARRGYPLGWSYVFGLYAKRRGTGMALLTGVNKILMGIAWLVGK